MLGGPSTRRDLPLTAGLPSGPGPGPEILGVRTTGRITTLLRRMADSSQGNPVLASLADQAAQQNI